MFICENDSIQQPKTNVTKAEKNNATEKNLLHLYEDYRATNRDKHARMIFLMIWIHAASSSIQ